MQQNYRVNNKYYPLPNTWYIHGYDVAFLLTSFDYQSNEVQLNCF